MGTMFFPAFHEVLDGFVDDYLRVNEYSCNEKFGD